MTSILHPESGGHEEYAIKAPMMVTLSRLVARVELSDADAPADPGVSCHDLGALLAEAKRLLERAGFRRCRVCGCSLHDPCAVSRGRGLRGCSWLDDDLCDAPACLLVANATRARSQRQRRRSSRR